MKLLSKTFRSIKCPILSKSNPSPSDPSSSPSSSSLPISRISRAKSGTRSWCVYLILSTNAPIKTYVGVTNNFSRRLKQHNGELKGGAKACHAGRPWICGCMIQGFNGQSEACEFESKWKSLSRKLPRKGKMDEKMRQSGDGSHALLQHRQKALNRVRGWLDCDHLKIEWKLDP